MYYDEVYSQNKMEDLHNNTSHLSIQNMHIYSIEPYNDFKKLVYFIIIFNQRYLNSTLMLK
jgi:hypothetical protein